MVFQSYALYPHMTVAENLSFGLKMRALPPRDQKLVEEAADAGDFTFCRAIRASCRVGKGSAWHGSCRRAASQSVSVRRTVVESGCSPAAADAPVSFCVCTGGSKRR